MYQLLFFSKINCEGTWNCIFLVRKLHVPLHVTGCTFFFSRLHWCQVQ
jgi:hypothetical protein